MTQKRNRTREVIIWKSEPVFLFFLFFYKKRVLVKNKLNLLLTIILYNTWALQLLAIKTKHYDIQIIYKR
jgi:hypothetical protein